MVWLVAAIAVVAVVVGSILHSRRTIPRFLVARASLATDEIHGHFRLLRNTVFWVLPVRLTGIGGARCRLDTSLVDEQPDLDIGGTTAGQLKPLTRGTAYLYVHPVWIEVWQRSSALTYRRVLAVERLEVHNDYQFIPHDPDGVGANSERYAKTYGTVMVSITQRLHLYFEVLLKPADIAPGPAADRGFA